jgi:hypothetical protein
VVAYHFQFYQAIFKKGNVSDSWKHWEVDSLHL